LGHLAASSCQTFDHPGCHHVSSNWLGRRSCRALGSVAHFGHCQFDYDSGRLTAVGKVILAEDFEHGVLTLLQVAGVGALEPNTVLMGWSEDALNQVQFTRAVKRIMELQKSLLVYSEAVWLTHHLEPVIDIWWRAKINGGFMLTLLHLFQEGGSGR